MVRAAALKVIVVGDDQLKLTGELDLDSAPLLRYALAQLPGDVTFDLADLTFIDSTGLRALLERLSRATITLVGPRSVVLKFLDLAGVRDHAGLVVRPSTEGKRTAGA